MSKYTPGPWKAAHRRGHDGGYNTEVFSEPHGLIATCAWTPKPCGKGVTETYRSANARVIAAAPDLLAALTALHAVCLSCDAEDPNAVAPDEATYTAAMDAAEAAIAAATGESP